MGCRRQESHAHVSLMCGITVAGRLTGGFRTIVSDLVAVIQVEELDARDL